MRRAVFLIALLTARIAWAHGAVHEQIRALDARIAQTPEDAELYLHRGRLYLEDRHFEEASRDFRHALELDPGLRAAHYFQGDSRLRSGDAAGAEREARAFLAALGKEDRGGLMRGYRLLGQSLAEQGRPAEAAEACRSALGQADEPDPGLYRECAGFSLAAGDRQEALRILDEGIDRLGPLTVLEEKAIEIELHAGHTDGALARLDRLAAAGPGRERWLAQKGEILERAGRPAEARQAFEAALAAIRALPPGRRKTRSILRLEQEVEERLQGL